MKMKLKPGDVELVRRSVQPPYNGVRADVIAAKDRLGATRTATVHFMAIIETYVKEHNGDWDAAYAAIQRGEGWRG